MTDCTETVELLPWLLNGSLEGDEREGVLRHLRACAACRSELATTAEALELFGGHVPSTELVAHAFGDPVADPGALARHLETCATCRDDLELARGALTLEALVAPPRRTSVRAWRAAALAAAAVAVLALAGLLVLPGQIARQARGDAAVELERLETEVGALRRLADELGHRIRAISQPLANVAVVEVLPSSFALRGGGEAVRVERGASGAVLILVTEAGGPFDDLRLTARTGDGTDVWRVDGLQLQETGDVTVLLPIGGLPTGRLDLELEGLSDGRWRLLDRYILDVR